MKIYCMPLGRTLDYKHAAPERTASKYATADMFSDVLFQVWPTRERMAKAIRKQERDATIYIPGGRWRAVVKLGETEGY